MARASGYFTPMIAAIVFASLIIVPLRFAVAEDSIADLKITKQGDSLHITATASDASVWANTQVLIDTERDQRTGYEVTGPGGHAYDFMLEGTTLYHFSGDTPTAWAWDKAGSGQRKVADKALSIDIDLKTVFGATPANKCTVLLRALTKDFQHVNAASSATSVDLSNDAAAPSPDAAPTTGTLAAVASQDHSDLILKVTALKAADLDTVLIFFDTDSDADTGFQPPADPHFGFEEMIQGESLSAHTGEVRGAWSWKTIGPVKRTIDGATAEFRFDAGLLKGKTIRMAVWQMSPDWQMRTGRYPDNDAGTIDINIDASKLHAEVDHPPLPFAAAHADKDLPARERFQKITSYCCYYGPGETSDLSHFDTVILHTPAQTAVEVKQLKDIGVVTIGYLSVGEDEKLRVGDGKGPGGKASWYFDKNGVGQPDRNATWNSWFANAADPQWRADRVAEAKRLCEPGPDQQIARSS